MDTNQEQHHTTQNTAIEAVPLSVCWKAQFFATLDEVHIIVLYLFSSRGNIFGRLACNEINLLSQWPCLTAVTKGAHPLSFYAHLLCEKWQRLSCLLQASLKIAKATTRGKFSLASKEPTSARQIPSHQVSETFLLMLLLHDVGHLNIVESSFLRVLIMFTLVPYHLESFVSSVDLQVFLCILNIITVGALIIPYWYLLLYVP
jgi:hypothetical protein